MYICMYGHYSKGKDQPGKVANPDCGQLNWENHYNNFPVPVHAREFGLARRFRPSRPASACSSPYILRLNLVLILPGFFTSSAAASTPSGQPRVCRATRNCVPMAFTAESPPAQGQ